MNFELTESLLRKLDSGQLRIGSAPDDVVHWLDGLGLPKSLARIMQHHWVQEDCSFDEANVDLLSATSIRNDEFTPALLKHRMLNVGNAINGDWFVIDFATEKCAPGFVSHEEWSGLPDETADPHDFFAPHAKTLEAFLQSVDKGQDMPIDYYEACEWNENRDE